MFFLWWPTAARKTSEVLQKQESAESASLANQTHESAATTRRKKCKEMREGWCRKLQPRVLQSSS